MAVCARYHRCVNEKNKENDGRPPTLEWVGDAATGYLRLLDQTVLPRRVAFIDCRDVETVWGAIKRLSVRGAPAIGVAAAYGCVVGAQKGAFAEAADYLATSRPTAVNLFWAIDRLRGVGADDPARLLEEAQAIHHEDVAMCRAIGEHGAGLIKQGSTVLTHCNAGALATSGIGTATAPMYVAHERGVSFSVFSDETRPLNQGARLTSWELAKAGIDVTLQADSAAAQLMQKGGVNLVITGADRIAANGDAANKIGTYMLAVLAKHHGVPFYVAAPSSTFDFDSATGDAIPIEQRDPTEVTGDYEGTDDAAIAACLSISNPAFDVTPAGLIKGLITERGIIEPVNAGRIAELLRG